MPTPLAGRIEQPGTKIGTIDDTSDASMGKICDPWKGPFLSQQLTRYLPKGCASGHEG